MSGPDTGDFNRAVIDEFHANAGVVGGPFAGRTLLLLHSIGARSGHPRVTPLAYLTIDGRMFVVGSYAGAPRDPAWVHNLRADPHARIEVGSDAYDVSVRELPLPERAEIYPEVVAAADAFAAHQAKTSRIIPLFELTRV
ncbi:MAG: nitroreductase family deazaflavin-dependent oxidoreductase [Mycolicibacterium cosmeticum]|nr:nitroreductase family deazaflavin-dependent oxidoreductase [Mycolicibacterium cosmeticum]